MEGPTTLPGNKVSRSGDIDDLSFQILSLEDEYPPLSQSPRNPNRSSTGSSSSGSPWQPRLSTSPLLPTPPSRQWNYASPPTSATWTPESANGESSLASNAPPFITYDPMRPPRSLSLSPSTGQGRPIFGRSRNFSPAYPDVIQPNRNASFTTFSPDYGPTTAPHDVLQPRRNASFTAISSDYVPMTAPHSTLGLARRNFSPNPSAVDQAWPIPSFTTIETDSVPATYGSGRNRECKFCKNNGETRHHYTSHVLRDETGRLVCPTLRMHVCEICGDTGDDAHTRNYCPSLKSRMRQALPVALKKTRRQSDGHVRL